MAREETIKILIDKSKTVAPLQELKNEAKALKDAFGSIKIGDAAKALKEQASAAKEAANAATAEAKAQKEAANAEKARYSAVKELENATKAHLAAQKEEQNVLAANMKVNKEAANAVSAAAKAQKEMTNAETAQIRQTILLTREQERQTAAMRRLGQDIGQVNASQAQSIQYMSQWIRQQEGFSNATIHATGAINNANGSFQTYRAAVSEAGGATHNYRMAVNTATGEVYQLDQGIRTTSVSLRDMSSILRAVRTVVGFTGIAQSMRSAFTEMKSMSDELVTYRKVTGATAQEMERIRSSAYETSKRYGQTPSDFLSQAATMARAGYGQNATAMAELATKTQLVGDMTADAASKFLIAVDAAYQFGGSVETLTKVLDGANVIDNNYATTIEKISEGMTLTASLASSAHVPVEQLTAALGVMTAVTQRSGTETARGLRQIMLNIIGDTTTEIEEGVTVAEEEMSAMQQALMRYTPEVVKAAQATGKLINPMEAIAALAKQYKEGLLTEQELFGITESIGGKRYYNVFTALIQNYDMYEEMLGKVMQSTGSADAEVAAMLDGWTAKAKQLTTTWTQVVNNTVSENFIKGLIDGGRQALEFAGNLENLAIMAGAALAAIRALTTGIQNLSAPGAKMNLDTFGRFNLGVGLLGIGITAIGVWKAAYENAIKEVQQKAAQTAQEAIAEMATTEKLEELQKQYESIMADGLQEEQGELEALKTLQDQLNGLVGDQGTAIDLVNGKYEVQKEALKQLARQQIENAKQRSEIARTEAMRSFRQTDLNGPLEWGTNAEGFSRTSVPLPFDYETGDDAETIRNLVADSYYLGYVSGEKFGNFLGVKKPDTFEEAVEFTREIKDLYTYAASTGLGERNPVFFDALSNLWKSVENAGGEAGSILEISDAIEEYDRQLEELEDQESSTAGSIEEATSAIEGQKDATVELTDAIDDATKAKEAFDEAMKNSKADAMNDYTKAFETLKEEIDAGRVNSTAFYASARMLMGDAAYNATGGNSLEVMAALNRKGASGSLLEARDILNQKYYYDGQEIQGYGIWELLSRTKGFDQRSLYDARGMMMVPELTQEQIQQISSSWGNLSENLIVSWLNALDQYDKTGQATDKNVEAQKTAEEQLGEESTTAADSVKTLGESAAEAANHLKEITDAGGDEEKDVSLSDIDTKELSNAVSDAVAEGFDNGTKTVGKQTDKISKDAEKATTSLFDQYDYASDKFLALLDAIQEAQGSIDTAIQKTGTSWEEIQGIMQEVGFDAVVDVESAKQTLQEWVQKYEHTELTFGLNADPSKAISTADSAIRNINQKKATIQIGAQYTGGIIGNLIAGFISGTRLANGTESHQGGAALVNDGTGANAGPELIVDKGRAFIAGGGEPAIVSLNKGAKVFTASETRSIFAGSGIPAYAKGTLPAAVDISGSGVTIGGKTGSTATGSKSGSASASGNPFSWITSFLGLDKNKITTTPPNGDGNKEGTGSGGGTSGGGSGGSEKKTDEKAYETLSAIVDYIIKRIGEALEEQIDAIDKQIDALKQQKDALKEQKELEEKQKAVAEAQKDLTDALNERTVRYLGDDGKWHWMADQRNVKSARESLTKAEEALREYEEEMVYNAQVKALENQKTALQEEYNRISKGWSDIQAGVATPTGNLGEAISAVLTGGTPQEQTGAKALRDYLIGQVIQGGVYSGNFAEAQEAIAKATAGTPVMPGDGSAALSSLIAASGLIGESGMTTPTLSPGITANMTAANAGGGLINYNYYVDGFKISGEEARTKPLSEIMRGLTVYAGEW